MNSLVDYPISGAETKMNQGVMQTMVISKRYTSNRAKQNTEIANDALGGTWKFAFGGVFLQYRCR
jgi:hypothetical protein